MKISGRYELEHGSRHEKFDVNIELSVEEFNELGGLSSNASNLLRDFVNKANNILTDANSWRKR